MSERQKISWDISIKDKKIIVTGNPDEAHYLANKIRLIMVYGKNSLANVSEIYLKGFDLEEFARWYIPEILDRDFLVHAEFDTQIGDFVIVRSVTEEMLFGSFV